MTGLDDVARELTTIRKLLVLALLQGGLTQNQVAGAMGIDRSGVSKMFSKGTLLGLRGGKAGGE